MSYDQHPWERQDEEIAKAFAAKNAEIEGLKARVEALRQIREEDKTLITELCDALEDYAGLRGHQGDLWLVQRAREATR